MLLTGTIRENIQLERENVDDEEMVRATKISLAHEFISRMPDGYDSRLADRGEGLSGGQKQSIALARALVGSPPILILDEPTSSVDHDTERRLIENLRSEFEGRTLILITHRPSLLSMTDRIIMMAAGRVAVDGPAEAIRSGVSKITTMRRAESGQRA